MANSSYISCFVFSCLVRLDLRHRDPWKPRLPTDDNHIVFNEVKNTSFLLLTFGLLAYPTAFSLYLRHPLTCLCTCIITPCLYGFFMILCFHGFRKPVISSLLFSEVLDLLTWYTISNAALLICWKALLWFLVPCLLPMISNIFISSAQAWHKLFLSTDPLLDVGTLLQAATRPAWSQLISRKDYVRLSHKYKPAGLLSSGKYALTRLLCMGRMEDF